MNQSKPIKKSQWLENEIRRLQDHGVDCMFFMERWDGTDEDLAEHTHITEAMRQGRIAQFIALNKRLLTDEEIASFKEKTNYDKKADAYLIDGGLNFRRNEYIAECLEDKTGE